MGLIELVPGGVCEIHVGARSGAAQEADPVTQAPGFAGGADEVSSRKRDAAFFPLSGKGQGESAVLLPPPKGEGWDGGEANRHRDSVYSAPWRLTGLLDALSSGAHSARASA
jgi:hypothetical protein